jgi:hypothetical protein
MQEEIKANKNEHALHVRNLILKSSLRKSEDQITSY